MEYEQGVPAAAWFTVNVWPPMVSVPLRAFPVFAAMVNDTLPLLVPLAPAVIVSHDALLTAVHAHPDPAVTATVVPAPAPAGAD